MDLNASFTRKLVIEPVKCPILKMDSFTYNLPDACISVLFDRLPLEDLLHCNLVCRKWNQLYRAACSRRRVLTLIILHPMTKPEYLYDKISVSSSCPFADWEDKRSPLRHSWLERDLRRFDHRFVTGLMDNFTNITSLEINIPVDAYDHIVQLLHFWANRLATLKLLLYLPKISFRTSYLVPTELPFIDAINSMSNLIHLTLNCNSRITSIYKKSNSEPILLIQLENLETFNYASEISYSYEDNYKAIFRYAQSHPKLRSIGFSQPILEQTDALVSCDPQIASRITQLYVQFDSEPELTRLCGNFSNLSTLELPYPRLPIPQWTKALSQCASLNHLKLTVYMSDLLSPYLLNPPCPREQIHQLKSLKALSVTFDTVGHSHLDLQTLQLAWIFPHIEMFYLGDFHLKCAICRADKSFINYVPTNYSESTRYDESYDHCRRLLLRPLKEMPHLKVVKYYSWNNGYEFYSKADL